VIRKQAPKPRPFYLQLDQFAPHAGPGTAKGPCAGPDVADPDPADYAQFAAEPLPTPPSYNEEDISDKPSFVQKEPPLTEEQVAAITQRYRCALASLVAVDRGMAAIDAALSAAGELDDTVVIFTSDNGFFYGEHRLPREKTVPYEEALQVPLIWRVPSQYLGGASQVRTAGELVGNIDIAPTILDFADAQPCLKAKCRVMDGRSLLGLMAGDSTGFPADRHLLIEQGVCGYRGVRNLTEIYLEHLGPRIEGTTGCEPQLELEHYDLAADPYQLKNLYPATSNAVLEAQGRLFSHLDPLRNCAGVEGRDPLPASGNYCE
jgi:N-acetylglucosamine-6-sulfatase